MQGINQRIAVRQWGIPLGDVTCQQTTLLRSPPNLIHLVEFYVQVGNAYIVQEVTLYIALVHIYRPDRLMRVVWTL